MFCFCLNFWTVVLFWTRFFIILSFSISNLISIANFVTVFFLRFMTPKFRFNSVLVCSISKPSTSWQEGWTFRPSWKLCWTPYFWTTFQILYMCSKLHVFLIFCFKNLLHERWSLKTSKRREYSMHFSGEKYLATWRSQKFTLKRQTSLFHLSSACYNLFCCFSTF